MEDRALRHLGHIGAIGAGARIDVIGREAHLVVHHDMDGASDLIGSQPGHLHYFINDTLPGHGRIAMDQDGRGDTLREVVVMLDDGT